MTAIAIIPARGGSKRLPGKNVAQLGERPLIGWAIDSAFEAGLFERVIVTTDDDDIALCVRKYSNNVTIFKRPNELAQDNTPMLPVVRHVMDCIASSMMAKPTDTVLLQPTSPFRTAEDIRAAYALYKERNADAVISVTDPEDDLVFRVGLAGRIRAVPDVVVPNGAIYILRAHALMNGQDWYSGLSYAYLMSKERSIDIDTPVDLAMARAALEHHAAA